MEQNTTESFFVRTLFVQNRNLFFLLHLSSLTPLGLGTLNAIKRAHVAPAAQLLAITEGAGGGGGVGSGVVVVVVVVRQPL